MTNVAIRLSVLITIIIVVFLLGAGFAILLRIVICKYCNCSRLQSRLKGLVELNTFINKKDISSEDDPISSTGSCTLSPATLSNVDNNSRDVCSFTICAEGSQSSPKKIYAEPFNVLQVTSMPSSSETADETIEAIKLKRMSLTEPNLSNGFETIPLSYGSVCSSPETFESYTESGTQSSMRKSIFHAGLKSRTPPSCSFEGLISPNIPEDTDIDNVLATQDSKIVAATGDSGLGRDVQVQMSKSMFRHVQEARFYQTESSSSSRSNSLTSSAENAFRRQRKYFKVKKMKNDFDPTSDLGAGTDNIAFYSTENGSGIDLNNPSFYRQFVKKLNSHRRQKMRLLRSLSTGSSNATVSEIESEI